MSATDVNRHGNPETLAAAAADFIVAEARKSILERKRFTLVLTGGSTPEQTYRMLARPERASEVDWSRMFVFAGDERFVPETDSRSNFGMARRALLDHVPVPAENLFPIPTSCASPAEGARLYGELLGRFFNQAPDSVPVPGFDLLLLGLGDDGHVASLFPGMPTLDVKEQWVTWSPPGTLPPPVNRVTLTMPVINAARSVLFIVSGEKKGAVVQRALEGPPDYKRVPATGVRPSSGSLHWFIDEPAASKLGPGEPPA
jgi:6-phosphogluconolactonase